ncbi:hypothetical protein OAA99_01325, partial [Omnitrophica bacterium]|nr:hypothetical protein [Candidatus Omnitrophota bacterium]MDB4349576.1 hypothetical protein [Candidatus Omnitrophota bacterium]
KEKIAAVFIPNKFFHFLHEMQFQRLKKLIDDGAVDKDRTLVVFTTLASTPAVTRWVEARQREGHKVQIVKTAVGFAKLANLMYRIEGERRKNIAAGELDKDITVYDASGRAVNVGPNPLLIAAWEESGGIITGITYEFADMMGRSFLAQREKSATESILLSLGLIAKLQQGLMEEEDEKGFVSEGEVDLAKYLEYLYKRDKVDVPIDIRLDNKLFTPGVGEESNMEKKAGNERKNRIFGAYISIVIAFKEGKLSLQEAKEILRDIFEEEHKHRSMHRRLWDDVESYVKGRDLHIEEVLRTFQKSFDLTLNEAEARQALQQLKRDFSIDENKQLRIWDIRSVLQAGFGKQLDVMSIQPPLGQGFIGRFTQVEIDSLADIRFTGDGVIFIFEKDERQWFVLFRPSGTEPKLKAYGFGEDVEQLTIDTFAFGFTENLAGILPVSFTEKKALRDIWGRTGHEAVEKAMRMQKTWEIFGRVVDPEDLDKAGMAELEKTRLVREFRPPVDHLEKIAGWVRDEELGMLDIDAMTSHQPAMPQKEIVALLEAIPDEVFAELNPDTSKAAIIASERRDVSTAFAEGPFTGSRSSAATVEAELAPLVEEVDMALGERDLDFVRELVQARRELESAGFPKRVIDRVEAALEEAEEAIDAPADVKIEMRDRDVSPPTIARGDRGVKRILSPTPAVVAGDVALPASASARRRVVSGRMADVDERWGEKFLALLSLAQPEVGTVTHYLPDELLEINGGIWDRVQRALNLNSDQSGNKYRIASVPGIKALRAMLKSLDATPEELLSMIESKLIGSPDRETAVLYLPAVIVERLGPEYTGRLTEKVTLRTYGEIEGKWLSPYTSYALIGLGDLHRCMETKEDVEKYAPLIETLHNAITYGAQFDASKLRLLIRGSETYTEDSFRYHTLEYLRLPAIRDVLGEELRRRQEEKMIEAVTKLAV